MDDKILETLTEGQRAAWNAVMAGHNVFLTGSGGTGKSFLTELIIYRLEKELCKQVIVCAPTGLAASKIKGATIHRVFGLGIDSVILSSGKLRKKMPAHILAADVIIIDEISMVRADLFDCIITSLSAAEKKSGKRKQLIVLGDFLQLPPFYSDDDDRNRVEKFYGHELPIPWAFLGNTWKYCNFENIVLTEITRQHDTELQENLNLARIGDPACITYFNTHSNRNHFENAIHLYSIKDYVDEDNKSHIRDLPGEPYYIPTYFHGSFLPSETDEVIKMTILKVGARVMVTTNDINRDEYARNVLDHLLGNEGVNKKYNQFVNGSLGTVYKIQIDPANPKNDAIFVFMDGTEEWIEIKRRNFQVYSYKTNDSGKISKTIVGYYSQIPVVPAYAITVHKSQGQTYNEMNFDPDKCFAEGQLYVALSRIKSISGLHLDRRIKTTDLKTNREAMLFYKKLKDNTAQHLHIRKRKGRKKIVKGIEIKEIKSVSKLGGRPRKFGKDEKKKTVDMKVPKEVADVLTRILAEAFPKDEKNIPDLNNYDKLVKHLKSYYKER